MPRPRKEVEAPSTLSVRVLWPNVWTSKGKLLRGDETDLPFDEAAALDQSDAIKIVR